MFGLSISEILIISLILVTSLNCILNYFCCSRTLKLFETKQNLRIAINKLRIYDQYVLSKVNLVVALFYFVVSYCFFSEINGANNFLLMFSCLLSFGLSLITIFVSRLYYCYTCNVLLETKINELDCFVLNLKRLVSIYLPFVICSFVVPFVYLLDIDYIWRHILCVISLALILCLWMIFNPKMVIFSNGAKKIEKNSFLRYRLEQVFEAHGIKKYELYLWDSSRSKEANAMVCGFKKYHLLLSSSLVEEITLPELESVILHEIGHIKNKHLLKLMIGKIFMIISITFMILAPYLFNLNYFYKVIFCFLTVLIVVLELIASIGVERRYELEADSYANCYSDSELFSSALKKIVKYEEVEHKNLVDEIFQSHPDIDQRIDVKEKEK